MKLKKCKSSQWWPKPEHILVSAYSISVIILKHLYSSPFQLYKNDGFQTEPNNVSIFSLLLCLSLMILELKNPPNWRTENRKINNFCSNCILTFAWSSHERKLRLKQDLRLIGMSGVDPSYFRGQSLDFIALFQPRAASLYAWANVFAPDFGKQKKYFLCHRSKFFSSPQDESLLFVWFLISWKHQILWEKMLRDHREIPKKILGNPEKISKNHGIWEMRFWNPGKILSKSPHGYFNEHYDIENLGGHSLQHYNFNSPRCQCVRWDNRPNNIFL